MYQAFDKFLAVPTWYTSHPTDEKRFYRALDDVVHDHNFNPDEMGAYLRGKAGSACDATIERLVIQAWDGKEFLAATAE